MEVAAVVQALDAVAPCPGGGHTGPSGPDLGLAGHDARLQLWWRSRALVLARRRPAGVVEVMVQWKAGEVCCGPAIWLL